MFSSSTANTLMSPFPQYYFPSSSPYYQPFQPLPQPQPQPQPPLPPPPSPPPPSPSLILNPNDNIFLHQSHQYNHLFSLANAQIPESTLINLGVISNTTTTTMANIMTSTSTTSSTKQDLIINCGGSRHSAPNFIRKKPGAAVSKKDRHSKIYTAQGLRDRRVRLSIDIAREFFDLHDMLGFDKASKTLEWLLTKSKKAIKEVSRSKLRTSTAAKSSTTLSSTGAANSDHYEQAMSEMNELVAAAADHDINLPTEEEEEEEDHNSPLVSKQKLIDAETLGEAASMNLLEKESRAKARARARTRAKEKRHNNYCTTTTSTTAYTNNNHKIRSSNYDNKMEKCSSGGGSSSHQISNHQLLIRSVLLNQLDHHQDIDHGQIQRLTPNSVEDKGLLFRMQANHDHDQDDEDEEQPVLMIKKKLYDHRDDHEEGQFCGISSKGGASNNVVYSSSPSLLLTQNWDNNNRIGTASPHPAASFCLPT